LKAFLKTVPDHVSKKANFYVSAHLRKNNELYLQVSQGDGIHGYGYISRDIVSKKSEAYVLNVLNKIRESLEKTYSNISLDGLNSDINIVRMNEANEPTTVSYNDYVRSMTETKYLAHNIGTDAEPNYVYSIQPVIKMDLSEIDGSQELLDKAEQDEVSIEETETFKEEENIRKRWTQATIDYIKEQTPPYEGAITPVYEDREDLSDADKAQIKQGLDEIDTQYMAELDAVGKKRVEVAAKEVKPKVKLKKRKSKYTRGTGRINNDDIESQSQQLDENEIFKQILAEYSDPDIDPDRKAELQEVLFGMYYAEGEMITLDEKREQARERMKTKRINKETGNIESLSVQPLTEEELIQM
ncbi:hypothetical protein LCGC14_3040240, partial [marine sediment metagenome]